MPSSKADSMNENSKSQRKKNMLALQKLGESLLSLSDSQLAAIELPDKLLAAIQHAKHLTSNEAKRRQLQYIGKIIREIDWPAIQQELEQIQLAHEKDTAKFREIEYWRDQLILENNDIIETFLKEYPHADRKQLRQLIIRAQDDRRMKKNTGGKKMLFRYLSSILSA
jgi:ribosome-associated protein